MSKAVLISIKPKWCELIADGEKTIEVRKTHPKLDTPFKCYIYETRGFERVGNDNLNCVVGGNGRGKVIGEFICDKLVWVISHPAVFAGHALLHQKAINDACLTNDEAEIYSAGKDVYGWHISDLVIYDKPRELGGLYRLCDGLDNTGRCWECDKAVGDEHDCGINGRLHLARPPQSWCYVEDVPDQRWSALSRPSGGKMYRSYLEK